MTAPALHVPKLTVREKIGYGFGDLASNLFWQMFSIFIAKFYTDVFLLGAATMGTMLLVTRMFDAVIDPLMGSIADRTHTRWGHFRPYLLWMSVPMALSAILTFTTPSFEGTARIVYAYLTMSLMMLAYTAINIPYSALLGVLTPSSEDRTSVSSYRFVMALLPVFIIVNTAIPMVEFFGNGSSVSPRGWQMTMVCYASVAVLLFLATFAMTKERVQPPAEQKSDLRTDVRNLFRNRPWVVLCVVGISALTYANIRGTVAIYYFEYVMTGGKALFGPVMTSGAAAFIAGVLVTSPLAKRFGKRNFYMAAMALSALLTVAFYFVPPSNVPLVWTMHVLISFVAAPTAPLVWAMYADTADYSEWKWGRRATGLIFSAASFAQKLGWAVGGAGTGWLLAYFGYVPNVAQSPETINGIKLMMSFIPTVGALLAIAALWFYDLDEGKVLQIGVDLEQRRGPEAPAGSQPAPGGPALQAAPEPARASTPPHPTEPPSPPSLSEATMPISHTPPPAPAAPATSAPPTPAFAAESARNGTSPVARALPPPLTPQEQADLSAEYRAVLQAGVHGLCFSPYVGTQAPGSQVSDTQIRDRLSTIAPYTRWVRSFSCTDGHEQTPRIAHELGMKTLVGAWLGTDAAINEREIEGVIAVARAGHADIVAVGNEVLLREDLTEDALLAFIERVKAALPGVSVGYVDAYYLFEKHPRVTAACDVILTNCYPFWEGCPREQAVAYMDSMLQRVRAVAGGKRVVVSETGWPDQGSPFHGALPSVAGAMRYFIDTQRWAQDSQVEVFYFAAFDEAWKVGTEGDVGAYWGLWDSHGARKFE
jgi:GPH family glycoside/pentoside/hexuronide:cation symporter